MLAAVRERSAYANLVLPGLLRERRLDTRDAALATELAYGTLRAQGQLDVVLQACVDRPLAQVDPPVLDLLRLGAYQLLRTRVPPHAAVSATVDLARRVTTAGPAAFVNAVLRKVSAKDLDTWLAELAPADEEVAALGARRPATRAGSRRRSATRCAATSARPGRRCSPTTPAPRCTWSPAGCPATSSSRCPAARPGPGPTGAVRLPAGAPGDLAPVRDGRAGVQDEGSQLVALALAAAPVEGPDRLWVDVCAGPGGKASLLESVADERGARLLALEVQPHRARLVRSSGVRDVVVADSRQLPVADGTADRVLLDAPCSGLGALRRRPGGPLAPRARRPAAR